MQKGEVIFGDTSFKSLYDYLDEKKGTYSKIFILTDTNTLNMCLPPLLEKVGNLTDYELIETEPGEENKSIETVLGIWNTFTDLGADRKSLLINLGGGVLTDMGGFAASTFKRGIDFINIPTTLLSMVDASTGGKTGIDLGMLKNQIGVFSLPQFVMISSDFLTTLDPRQMRSGLAEMFKHGLIADKDHWNSLKNLESIDQNGLDELIKHSVSVKIKVVQEDPTEKGLRKILNFGHTIGHALETHFMNSDKMILHGEAIAAGMIAEAYLSTIYSSLLTEEAEEIKSTILEYFPKTDISQDDIRAVLDLMKHDKKNVSGKVNFSLLKKIGKCDYDKYAGDEDIIKSIEFYLK